MLEVVASAHKPKPRAAGRVAHFSTLDTPARFSVLFKYVEEFREHELEQDAGFHVKIDDVETTKLNKKSLQKMLYNEIRAFHRQAPTDHGADDEIKL